MARTKARTKEQIIVALQSAARELGHAPTSVELRRITGITVRQVAGRFQTYRAAVCIAGLTPDQMGLRVEAATLLEDWGQVVRKVGAVPSRKEYDEAGSYSWHCFTRCFQGWLEIPQAFCKFVAGGGLAGDWSDVLESIRWSPMPIGGVPGVLAKKREAARAAYEARASEPAQATEAPSQKEVEIRQHVATAETRQQEFNTANAQLLPPPLWGKKCVTATMLAVFVAELAPAGLQWITAACFPRRPLKDRPLLGAPTRLPAFPYEPVNEMGVMVLFSMLAQQLGFVIESVQAGFPDCEAKIEVEPGRWQHFRIEFEYESRAFKLHGHDPRQCDLIVCWRHNWKNCPPNLQVLELSKIVSQIG
ncbi:MAG: homing endonuclease associated repeat-containing protein [Candidatus Angelobacter sp.]